MKNTYRRACVTVVLMLPLAHVTGCATYSRSGDFFRHRRTGLEVKLPDDWLRYKPARPAITLTRDGLRLEAITISVTRVGKDVSGTERVYRANMLPHEIAELSLGLVEERDDTKNFNVERIELATVAGRDGYQAEARYVDEQGLKKRLWVYGAMIADYLCEFWYSGAESVYFERYLPVFQSLVSSATIADRTGAR